MTYKKYIMRNGKMYGPYEYHSKRENGKVVSEYYGKHNKLNFKLNYNYIWWVFAGVILIALFYYAYNGFNGNSSLTGKAVMDLSANYIENKSLDGKVKIELNQGEFIPASSKLIIETSSGKNYEYSLKDLISENLSNGDFYIEGTQISGNGEGYGISGTKKSTEVYFTLEILKKNKDDKKNIEKEETETSSETPTSTETPTKIPTETKTENKTTEENITIINEKNKTDVIINENKSNEEVKEVEEDVNKTETTEIPTTSETIPETPTETKTPETTTETPSEKTTPEVKKEAKETTSTETTTTSESKSEVPTGTTSTETIQEQTPKTESETKTPETTSETPTKVPTETTSTEKNTEASAPITGGVIGARKNFLNFFKFFRLTGKAVDSSSSEIEGKVSKGSTFNYTLNSGETARIKPGSVRTIEKNLSEKDISLKVNKNKVVVKTDYSESETGFGEEYTGEDKKELIVDLNSLNISPEKGDLKIKISYEGTDILSLTANLSEGNVSIIKTTINQSLNQTLNQTINQTINQTVNLLELTENEKKILLEHFGNISINTTKAEVFNGRLIVKYELENYWVEYSYDYNNNSLSNLNLKMEKDRTKWLKDLASMLNKESKKSEKEEINELIQNYSI